ncbi:MULTISPECIES: hypothetical protein [Leptolyngbya]|uniref:Uncharacterized protein n=3 Tax=Leptolyngbya group TaxID=3081713 RepID=A0A1Z4JHK7_LEPBY|nr:MULTISPECIES: hypothetical protein [Leptolyngbya]BAS57647.1 hypothetical protein LBWT_36070 [Leptolyngbya boryana IAM M-101]BAY56158.1 hypothetical protein NIES2135_29880 [Leptolyngbya boryana NIES-2135]MCY6491668.1 hypothetical protein [Leptolyngbya sp. GGD]ULP33022.1 hypothetical protein MCP04_14895 [Leptolyngbya boryana IU 594]WNZ44923.1 hypothetical protein Q2T42_24315 [Leptolyngbya boryana CZ1]
MTVTGVIQRKGFGTGTWAIDAEDGKTYELHKPPKDLQKAGLKVKVDGEIRDDVMSFAMVGQILEVKTFELL